jgi:hypothetical protein
MANNDYNSSVTEQSLFHENRHGSALVYSCSGVMWMTSMGWLVSTKLWPLLWAGTPPSNLTLYTQQNAAHAAKLPPIGWKMSWGGKTVGVGCFE